MKNYNFKAFSKEYQNEKINKEFNLSKNDKEQLEYIKQCYEDLKKENKLEPLFFEDEICVTEETSNIISEFMELTKTEEREAIEFLIQEGFQSLKQKYNF